jgi:mevalonate kinase
LVANPFPGIGLASSSAVAVALSFGLEVVLRGSSSKNSAAHYGFSYEHQIGGGGGMDHQAIALGGLVLTAGTYGRLPSVEARHSISGDDICFLLIDSQLPKRSDSVLAGLRRSTHTHLSIFDRYLSEASYISTEIERALLTFRLNDVHLGINAAHEALSLLPGVISPQLNELRQIVLAAGVPSVKLCGSGPGGALISVLPRQDGEETAARLRQRISGLNVSVASPDMNGVEFNYDDHH